MDNKELQVKYNDIYSSIKKFFFSDGEEERLTIYRMGRPWKGKTVLEIGCGEGHLVAMIQAAGGSIVGLDYSATAINNALQYYPHLTFLNTDYHIIAEWREPTTDILIMQGVLEHLDNPWTELKWMLDNLVAEKGTVITSSPCFLNPRGYVWICLAAMFDVPMSLTDLHFLHPWQFVEFGKENQLEVQMLTCDLSWGNGPDMLEDLKDRLPKAMRDLQKKLNIQIPYRTTELLEFLKSSSEFLDWDNAIGATAVYKLVKK